MQVAFFHAVHHRIRHGLMFSAMLMFAGTVPMFLSRNGFGDAGHACCRGQRAETHDTGGAEQKLAPVDGK